MLEHDKQLDTLAARVRSLEKGGHSVDPLPQRAVLSHGFIDARRSVRLWPIEGTNPNQLWENTGGFLHVTLGISETDLCQDDIESITRIPPDGLTSVRAVDEVLVRFFDKRKRDLVMSSSPRLADSVDPDGRPTAGIRLEIPTELDDTFRLLSRFGARLRARHGEGTKRHIKFDDYHGSLFANIKLPGDANWTRVTPGEAREDLEASIREESRHNQKRMAAKLVPGPRERLGRPLTIANEAVSAVRPITRGQPPGQPSGKRPRWSNPNVDPNSRQV